MKYSKIITSLSVSLILVLLFISEGNELVSYAGIDTKKAESLYTKHCVKCHRKDGAGIKRIYPPLKNSDYIKNNKTQELLRGMLFGRNGKITVNGINYNGVMITELDKNVKDEDVALVLAYVYQYYNSLNLSVTAKDVKEARKAGKLPNHK